MSDDTASDRAARRPRAARSAAGRGCTEYRPFCSARCRDIDLGRWFGEVYTVPAAEPGYDEDETPDAPSGKTAKPS